MTDVKINSKVKIDQQLQNYALYDQYQVLLLFALNVAQKQLLAHSMEIMEIEIDI